MAHTRATPQRGPNDARSIEKPHIAGARDNDESKAIDDRGRRWYRLRPEPRRRTDLMGFNAIWWVLLWLLLIVVFIYPVPWWWW